MSKVKSINNIGQNELKFLTSVEEDEEDEEDEGRGCGVVPPMTSSGVVGAKRLGDVLMPPLMPPPMLKGTMAWLGNNGEMVDIQMSYTLSKVKQC